MPSATQSTTGEIDLLYRLPDDMVQDWDTFKRMTRLDEVVVICRDKENSDAEPIAFSRDAGVERRNE